jgi:SH3-like domain-containing protein
MGSISITTTTYGIQYSCKPIFNSIKSRFDNFRTGPKSALSADWAHLPIPKDVQLFDRLVDAGEKVTRLLDAARDASDVIRTVVGVDRARTLGALRRIDGKQIRADDLKVAVSTGVGARVDGSRVRLPLKNCPGPITPKHGVNERATCS